MTHHYNFQIWYNYFMHFIYFISILSCFYIWYTWWLDIHSWLAFLIFFLKPWLKPWKVWWTHEGVTYTLVLLTSIQSKLNLCKITRKLCLRCILTLSTINCYSLFLKSLKRRQSKGNHTRQVTLRIRDNLFSMRHLQASTINTTTIIDNSIKQTFKYNTRWWLTHTHTHIHTRLLFIKQTEKVICCWISFLRLNQLQLSWLKVD